MSANPLTPVSVVKNRKFLSILSLLACAFTPHFAFATTTWTGTTSGDWNAAGNWSNGAPAAANAAVFYAPGAANLNISLSASGNAAGITFGDNASSNVTVNFTGGLLRLASGGTIAVTEGSTGTHSLLGPSNLVLGTSNLSGIVTENLSITNDSARLFTIGASIQAPTQSSGSITKNLTFSGSGNTLVSSAFIVSSPLVETLNITKQGSGTVTFGSPTSANNGAVTINGGVLEAAFLASGSSASSIGNSGTAASNLVLNGGALRYIGSTGTMTNRLFTVGTNGGALDASGASAVTFSATSAVTLAGANSARTLTLTGANTGSNTLAASIGDNGTGVTSLAKSGAGKWVLTGAHSYTGTTTVSAGTLVLSGGGSIASSAAIHLSGSSAVFDVSSTSFTLQNGQTLKGVGTVLGNVSTGSGSILSPGNSAGILKITGNLSLGDFTNFSYEQGDIVQVTGGLTLGTGLTLVSATDLAVGTYDLFTYTGALSNAGDLTSWTATGLTNSYSFLSDADSVYLAVVPEPSSWAMSGLGLAIVFALCRRGKSQLEIGKRTCSYLGV